MDGKNYMEIVEKIQETGAMVLSRIQALTIRTPEDAETMAALRNEADHRMREIKSVCDPMIASAHQTHKMLTAFRAEALSRWETGKQYAGDQIARWSQEQEEARKKEEARLQKAAQAQAEKDAKAAIRDMKKSGASKEEIAAIKAAPVVAPVVQIAPVKIEGMSTVERWTFDIVDEAAIPREYLMPDEKRIARVVTAMKGDAKIPGIRAYPEKSVRRA